MKIRENSAMIAAQRWASVLILASSLLGSSSADAQGFGNNFSAPPQAPGTGSYVPTNSGGGEPFARMAQLPGGGSPSIPPGSPIEQGAGAVAEGAAIGEVAAEGEGAAVGQSGVFSGLLERLMAGGPLMLPLGLCSLVVIALAVERMVALRRSRVIPRPFVRRFTECVQDGQLSHEEALEICDEFDCPVAEVFHATVKRWGRPTVEIEQAVMDAGERVADGLRKYLRLFSAVSNVSPLLGLLGTVLGMIEAFEALSSSDASAPPDMLASGISEALITTAAGLSVAIPAYLAYVYFSARADKYLVEIDALCQQVVESISAEGMSGTTTSRGTRRQKRAA